MTNHVIMRVGLLITSVKVLRIIVMCLEKYY